MHFTVKFRIFGLLLVLFWFKGCASKGSHLFFFVFFDKFCQICVTKHYAINTFAKNANNLTKNICFGLFLFFGF